MISIGVYVVCVLLLLWAVAIWFDKKRVLLPVPLALAATLLVVIYIFGADWNQSFDMLVDPDHHPAPRSEHIVRDGVEILRFWDNGSWHYIPLPDTLAQGSPQAAAPPSPASEDTSAADDATKGLIITPPPPVTGPGLGAGAVFHVNATTPNVTVDPATGLDLNPVTPAEPQLADGKSEAQGPHFGDTLPKPDAKGAPPAAPLSADDLVRAAAAAAAKAMPPAAPSAQPAQPAASPAPTAPAKP